MQGWNEFQYSMLSCHIALELGSFFLLNIIPTLLFLIWIEIVVTLLNNYRMTFLANPSRSNSRTQWGDTSRDLYHRDTWWSQIIGLLMWFLVICCLLTKSDSESVTIVARGNTDSNDVTNGAQTGRGREDFLFLCNASVPLTKAIDQLV